VPGPDGQLAYQVGFGSVIEERKQLEEQLRQSNELLEERVKQRTIELRQANETLTRLMGQRQELEKKLLEISERERRFMGRELHDGLCQQIVGVMCMFEAVRARLARKKVAEESELTMMRDFLQDSVMQIRTLSRGLCPLALDPHSVGAALSTIAVQTSVLYKIECRFSGSVNVSVADADAALHLYRITQEAIQNGIRHGSAQKIAIGLTADSENISITIENDGRPLSVEAGKLSTKAVSEAGSGLGLKLIDYRVGLLRGTWKIENQPQNAGVRLTINAPIYGGNYNEATVA
jgi:signal transduction histidine kinase